MYFEPKSEMLWVKNNFSDKDFTRKVYYEHIENVKKTIPNDRLLIYRVNEGWGPLCEFLDVDIPESIPFPKVNDTAEMLRKFALIRSLPYLFILFLVGISVLLLRLI